jgi:hypothetical protein
MAGSTGAGGSGGGSGAGAGAAAAGAGAGGTWRGVDVDGSSGGAGGAAGANMSFNSISGVPLPTPALAHFAAGGVRVASSALGPGGVGVGSDRGGSERASAPHLLLEEQAAAHAQHPHHYVHKGDPNHGAAAFTAPVGGSGGGGLGVAGAMAGVATRPSDADLARAASVLAACADPLAPLAPADLPALQSAIAGADAAQLAFLQRAVAGARLLAGAALVAEARAADAARALRTKGVGGVGGVGAAGAGPAVSAAPEPPASAAAVPLAPLRSPSPGGDLPVGSPRAVDEAAAAVRAQIEHRLRAKGLAGSSHAAVEAIAAAVASTPMPSAPTPSARVSQAVQMDESETI